MERAPGFGRGAALGAMNAREALARLKRLGVPTSFLSVWFLGPVGMKATSFPSGFTTSTPGRLPSRTVR